MLTIEQYISKMKKRDNVDEFNFKSHAANMAAIIGYVTEYFNVYLDPVEYDHEQVKYEQALEKVKKEIENSFPNSLEFLLQFYREHKTRLDRALRNWFKDLEYKDLLYCSEDYAKAVDDFCANSNMKGMDVGQYKGQLQVLAREIKERDVEKLRLSDFKHLDNSLVAWIKETYRQYGVNLFQFAQSWTSSYHDKYIEYVYDREYETSYYINRYNHRYNENPFGIDDVYEDNQHRPFIEGKKGELEMLLMYVWLFEDVMDTDYWPEYVNLCITTGRVSLTHSMNILIPVRRGDIPYPPDIECSREYIETNTGQVKNQPHGAYILRLNYPNDDDSMWRDEAKLDHIIDNLTAQFKTNRVPEVLELLSPLRSPDYKEEQFFNMYRVLEKRMKKYNSMKIALANGPHRSSGKAKYLAQTAEDFVRIKHMASEMKFKLRFAVDLSKLIKRKGYKNDFEDDFNKLSTIRNSIVVIHLSGIGASTSWSNSYRSDDKEYLNAFNYPRVSDFLGSISALFNDNLPRYYVPEGLKNGEALEELVDGLLRGGFLFYKPVKPNE